MVPISCKVIYVHFLLNQIMLRLICPLFVTCITLQIVTFAFSIINENSHLLNRKIILLWIVKASRKLKK